MPQEGEDEVYEVIETPGARQDLVTQLITMDLSERPAIQQMAIGGMAGWFAGYLCKKVGKATLSAVGSGILLLQVAHRAGYIKINWGKVERKMDTISRKVEREVGKITTGNMENSQKLMTWAEGGFHFAKRNAIAATGFAGGFFLGMAF